MTEESHHSRRQWAPPAQNLRESGVIGNKVTRESAERIMRIALAAPRKLNFKTLSELHVSLLRRRSAACQ
jgi:hypothetical protein